MPADVGTGTTVVFANSAFSAEITNVDGSGISRESFDTSHLGTTIFSTHRPGDLTNPGELGLEILFEPDDEPPWDDAIEVITVTFPLEGGQATPAKWVASGFLTDFGFTAPLEELMTATMTIKFTGAIVVTAAV